MCVYVCVCVCVRACSKQGSIVEARKQLWKPGRNCGSKEGIVEARKELWKQGRNCGSKELRVREAMLRTHDGPNSPRWHCGTHSATDAPGRLARRGPLVPGSDGAVRVHAACCRTSACWLNVDDSRNAARSRASTCCSAPRCSCSGQPTCGCCSGRRVHDGQCSLTRMRGIEQA